jgi:hypothetical protein
MVITDGHPTPQSVQYVRTVVVGVIIRGAVSYRDIARHSYAVTRDGRLI